MNKKTVFTSNVFRVLDNLGKQRHLYAVKGGFVYMVPIMIAGSLAVLLNNFPLEGYHAFMRSVFGEGWTTFGGYLWSVTFAVISMSATITVSASLATWYRTRKSVEISSTQCSLIALSCYLAACYPTDGQLTSAVTDSTGLFVAIIISLFTTDMIIILRNKMKIRSFMFLNEADGRIANAFSTMLPSLFMLILFAAFRVCIHVFELKPLNEMIFDLFQKPFEGLGNNIFSAVLFIFSANAMWVFGIHGNNVLNNVATNIFQPAVYENAAAVAAGYAPPNIFSKTFFDTFIYIGGSGATICLIIAMLLFARRSSQSRLSKISLIPGIFNINELLMYGLPIILNPIYVIPFALTPLVLLFTSTLATWLGLVPYAISEVTWTAPVFISGYAATRSWAGVALQFVNLCAGIAVYAPFVRLAEKLRVRHFRETYDELRAVCEDDYSGGKLLSRDDDVGSVARLLAFDMEKAIAADVFEYYFQPIVDNKANRVAGAETLLRWKHPEYGMISPMVIVALAEERGLVRRLGQIALRASCAGLKSFHDAGFPIYTSVNFSASELEDPGFADDIIGIVREYGLPFESVKIEVTETLAIRNNDTTNSNIIKLGNTGFSIAIDDFGMGHSSLVYIRRFPISMLKVDKSLSKDIRTIPENLEIINSIHTLCNSLGIAMVIEYVENEEQLELLNGIGCSLYQGYHYSKPLPQKEFLEYLKSWK